MRHRSVVLVAVATTLAIGVIQPAVGNAESSKAEPPGRAAFKAGAAVEDITPPPFGAVPNDAADCAPPFASALPFDGLRRFAFEEPYNDAANAGTYQLGDPFVDCNGNGRWDGILLGGGADTPRFPTTVADPVTARALVVSNHQSTIAVEVLDQEGLFNVYQDRIRAQVLADGYHLDGIFISATHDESAPDTLGISGVSQTTSGVDAYYADFLVAQSAKAIESAYDELRPARIKYAEAIEPANLRQCFSSYPFVDDQLMPSLQAVATNGRVIATLGDVSQHAETLGFNPDPAQRNWISSDWPHFFRTTLEQRYGGVASEMAGSVGNTLNNSGAYSASDTIWGARSSVCVPLTNLLFQFGAQLGVFAARPGYSDNCTVEHPVAPDGTTTGDEIKSSVAAFRIGDGEFISVPGEVFPFTYLRSFLGPDDMPLPQYPLPPWVATHMHAPYRFVDGLAEDMLGYIFPRGNGVGVIGEPDATDGTDRFGCGHSDDSEAASSQTGDIVGNGLVAVLDAREGAPEDVQVGRYVLPDGTLSRNPQGQPSSIKCDVDMVFDPTGPAVAVWIASAPGNHVVTPAAWMSLSGRRQQAPDRNTRGWLSPDGTRHWLDVFPDVGGAPANILH